MPIDVGRYHRQHLLGLIHSYEHADSCYGWALILSLNMHPCLLPSSICQLYPLICTPFLPVRLILSHSFPALISICISHVITQGTTQEQSAPTEMHVSLQ